MRLWPRLLLKGIFDYCGTYLVNHAGFGMITEPAQRSLQLGLAALVRFFSRSTRPGRWSRPSSTTLSACSMRCRACWRNSCSSSSASLYCGRGRGAGPGPGVGAAAVRSIHRLCPRVRIGRRGAHHHTARTGSVGRRAKSSARDHHRQPHRESVWYGVVGSRAISGSREPSVSRQPALCGSGGHQLSADG